VPVDASGLYDELALAGLEYGPVFRGVTAVWRRDGEVFAEVELPERARDLVRRVGVHPALLDACLHPALFSDGPGEAPGPVLPFAWSDVRLHSTGATHVRVHLRPHDTTGGVALTVTDHAGLPVASVGSVVARPVTAGSAGSGDDPVYRVNWRPVPSAATVPAWITWDDALNDPAETAVPVVYECPAPDLDVADAARQVAGEVLAVVRRWLTEERFAASTLAVVTRGAVPVPGAPVDLRQAPVWGLVRAAQAEHPGRFLLVDVDDVSSIGLALSTGEPEVAVRAAQALLPRLERSATPQPGGLVPASDPVSPPAAAGPVPAVTSGSTSAATAGSVSAPVRAAASGSPATAHGSVPATASGPGCTFGADGTVLVTGGTGGLGALVARHLVVGHGVRRLLLVSRRGTTATGAAALRDELAELGAHTEIAACDVSDRAALAVLIGAIDPAHPLRGVVHAAGVLDDALVTTLTAERLDAVFAPKAGAAWHLHELTAGLDLTAFVMISSIAGTIGSTGQANYSAANAFLDVFAMHRRAAGLPATAMAFGLWDADTGMGGRLAAADRERMRRTGIPAVSVEDGLSRFDAALRADAAATVPVKLDFASLRARAAELPAVLRGLVKAPVRGPGRAAAGDPALRARLAGLTGGDRTREVLGLVRAKVAAVLGHASGDAIEPARAFDEMGFDSLGAVELRNQLGAATGLRLPATLVFDYPTAQAVTGHLLGLLDGVREVVRERSEPKAVDDDPIVIVGMACRYPGGVSSPEDLWRLVAGGLDAVGGFPEDRGWDPGVYDPEPGLPGKTYARDGAFLYGAADFDADFFDVSPREAVEMDPQQRLALEVSWEAVERAGIDPRSLRGSRTGVFAGVMYHDYAGGSAASFVSGRTSYTLGLEGPAVTVDTACSSSLVALHLAAQALRSGECSLALAGGVTVMATPEVFVEFSRQRGLSADGRCRS
ncbi:SDR family NAD(P)-dependent oxidoreductase, partial [Sphaerisporangium sp. TRM90804]|uniref:SDR family NAD(P)-dependent oxidoreductase n=1 Tax=Sphaerisporangium sp. TRM90804 TaxID=3031113 RepID=UPI00244752B5